MMRTTKAIGIAAIVCVVVGTRGVAGVRAQGSDAKANDVIAQARKALGGEKKLAALKGLSLKAEYRRELNAGLGGGGAMTLVMMGGPAGGAGGPSGQATGEIEIDVAFPDKFYRQDSGTGAMALTRIDGFEGARPFIDVVASSPGMRVTVDRPDGDAERTKAALKRSHTDLARLMLGLIAGTQPGFSATYSYAGVAESPDGSAHMIDVAGPEDFEARLYIDTAMHQPLMLTFMEPEARPIRMMTRGPGGGGSANTVVSPHGTTTTATTAGQSASGSALSQLTPEQRAELEKQMKEAASAPPKLVEQRLYFADYREVDGLQLPHRITKSTAGKPTEEWDVKSYKVNPTIKPDRFKVGTN
jgi:hypothetical protein